MMTELYNQELRKTKSNLMMRVDLLGTQQMITYFICKSLVPIPLGRFQLKAIKIGIYLI